MRFGFRHAFSPGSVLIGNFMYSKSDLIQDDRVEIPTFVDFGDGLVFPATFEDLINIKSDNKAYSGELSHLFRSRYVNTVSGVGYFRTDSTITMAQDLTLILFGDVTPIPVPTEISDSGVRHTNLYLYSYLSYPENLTFTIGASGDFFNGGVSAAEDKNQVNPKFGVTWKPVPGTTLRGAVFRTLTRTLVNDQTLEPTQVAGFNQFFDEARSTDAWCYGAAVDQKFSKSVYGGLEFSKRDLDVPAPVGGTIPDTRVDWEEDLGRAYLFWTPHKWLGLERGISL